MWEDILNIIISNGIFAVLFCLLLFYQLKDSKAREEKYQKTIEKLANHLDIVEDIKDELVEVKKQTLLCSKKKERKTSEI